MAGENEYYGGFYGEMTPISAYRGLPDMFIRTSEISGHPDYAQAHADTKRVIAEFKQREIDGKIQCLTLRQTGILSGDLRGTQEQWEEIEAVIESRVASLREIRLEILGGVQSGSLK